MRPHSTPRLDAKDRQVLYELDSDGGRCLSDIGKKLGMNRDVMHYRVRRLENSKIITGYKLKIDYGKIGYLLGGVRVKLHGDNFEVRKKIVAFYKKKEVVFLNEMEDVLEVGFTAKNVLEIKEKQKELVVPFRKYFKNVETIIYTRRFYFGKRYLTGIKGKGKEIVYGNERIDGVDEKIVALMVKDPLLMNSEIAEKIDVSPGQVHYRIKKLEGRGVILGTRADVDLNKLGMVKYRLKISVEDSILNSVIAHLSKNENVVDGYDGIGLSDFEVDVEVKEYGELIGIVEGLKEKFSGKIDIEHWRYYYISNIGK